MRKKQRPEKTLNKNIPLTEQIDLRTAYWSIKMNSTERVKCKNVDITVQNAFMQTIPNQKNNFPLLNDYRACVSKVLWILKATYRLIVFVTFSQVQLVRAIYTKEAFETLDINICQQKSIVESCEITNLTQLASGTPSVVNDSTTLECCHLKRWIYNRREPRTSSSYSRPGHRACRTEGNQGKLLKWMNTTDC